MKIFVGMLVGWVALGAVGCSLAEGDAEPGKARWARILAITAGSSAGVVGEGHCA